MFSVSRTNLSLTLLLFGLFLLLPVPTRSASQEGPPKSDVTSDGSFDIAEGMIHPGAKDISESKKSDRPLFNAVKAGDLPTVKALITKGADSQFALAAAIVEKQDAIAREMLNDGVKVDVVTADGNNPFLSLAVLGDREQIFESLVNHGANPLQNGPDGDNVYLGLTILTGEADLFKFLISKNAVIKIDQKTDPYPIVTEAVMGGSREIVQWLLDHGADINATDSDGETSLDAAVDDEGKPEIAELLLQHGAKINAVDHRGRTALRYAVKHTDKGITKKLLCIKTLLGHGADVNATKSSEGETLLEAAVDGGGNPEVVELLLQSGAKINAIDNHGQTALMYSMGHFDSKITNNILCMKVLLAHGANTRIKNKDGKTALDLADDKPFEDLLRKAHAK